MCGCVASMERSSPRDQVRLVLGCLCVYLFVCLISYVFERFCDYIVLCLSSYVW